ncbi:conserved Plasmodium protein, unknown function [Plasmodium ovale]|uniref:Uncharacterized protein n=1 Tax=Plasmodium ovale TaxID=36330 RepID=A0A1D3KY65_PLAOA|nr:conserved Plasmodium protein, unknown function [Plasmodium ovale]
MNESKGNNNTNMDNEKQKKKQKKRETTNKITNFFKIIKSDVRSDESIHFSDSKNGDYGATVSGAPATGETTTVASASSIKQYVHVNAKETTLKKKDINAETSEYTFLTNPNGAEQVKFAQPPLDNIKSKSFLFANTECTENHFFVLNAETHAQRCEQPNVSYAPSRGVKRITALGSILKKRHKGVIARVGEAAQVTDVDRINDYSDDLKRDTHADEVPSACERKACVREKTNMRQIFKIPEKKSSAKKPRKVSLVNLFGNDIEIKVNVDEEMYSENETSSESSFTGLSKSSHVVKNQKNGAEWIPKEPRASYKRNSISDCENYNHKRCLVSLTSEQMVRGSICRDESTCGKKGNKGKETNETSLARKEREEDMNIPACNNRTSDNKRMLYSDNEFELKNVRKTRYQNARSSYLGGGTTIGNRKKSKSNNNRRRSCLDVVFSTNFGKLEKEEGGNLSLGMTDTETAKGEKKRDTQSTTHVIASTAIIKHANGACEQTKGERKEDAYDAYGAYDTCDAYDTHDSHVVCDSAGANGSNFAVSYYDIQKNVQDKLITIKNSFRLTDNVNDILNEKRRIKVLKILNKYYFKKEYNNYVNSKEESYQRRKMFSSHDLLRDSCNQPFTFYIAGKFNLFSTFLLNKKLRDYGYNISTNLRRANSLILGHDLNPDFVRKIKNFNGFIFNERSILLHLKINFYKYINLYAPINKNNGKKYKYLMNEINIKGASTISLCRKVHNFCKVISDTIRILRTRTSMHVSEDKTIDDKSLFFNLKKKSDNFFLFLHIARRKFEFDTNSVLLHCKKKCSLYLDFLEEVTHVFASCSVRKGTIVCTRGGNTYTGETSSGETNSGETNPVETEGGSDSSLCHLSPSDDYEVGELRDTCAVGTAEKQIERDMHRSEKLKEVNSLWSVFFRPNSLYEIAGHKNEILRLYKILRKRFPGVSKDGKGGNAELRDGENKGKGQMENTKGDNVKEKKKVKRKEVGTPLSKIIFVVYPPNCGVKRAVELICYACDLCPIYENKVQKYKNINYFFKYTHGLKAISIYNANKLDKCTMVELSTRNDVCICLYEDKNYIRNDFNTFHYPLLDNVNHTLVNFSYPTKDALFYRCFAVSSCIIKNVKRETLKMLFQMCRLKNGYYSLESAYSKLHLISSYVRYATAKSSMQGSHSPIGGDSQGKIIPEGFPWEDERNDPSFPNNVIRDYIRGHLLNKFFISNYEEMEEEISATGKPAHIAKRTNLGKLKKLNRDYYFYRGFDEEEIADIVHDAHDRLFFINKHIRLHFRAVTSSAPISSAGGSNSRSRDSPSRESLSSASLSEEGYLHTDEASILERENVFMKVMELFLLSFILIKSEDMNVCLLAVDMAVYWVHFLYMSPLFSVKRKKEKKKEKNIHKRGSTCGIGGSSDSSDGNTSSNGSDDEFANQVRLKDNFRSKMDKCTKALSEKGRKYRNLMLHFRCPFNFSSAGLVHDALQGDKNAGLTKRR